MKEKKKKDRRTHMSTVYMTAVAALIGIVALTFSYTNAWGNRMKNIETTASTGVFETFEAETLTGEAFTNEDTSGSKVTAFNVWETT